MSVKMNVTMNVEGYREAKDVRKWHYRVAYVDYMSQFIVVAGTSNPNPVTYDYAGAWMFADHDEAQDVADEMNRVGAEHFAKP